HPLERLDNCSIKLRTGCNFGRERAGRQKVFLPQKVRRGMIGGKASGDPAKPIARDLTKKLFETWVSYNLQELGRIAGYRLPDGIQILRKRHVEPASDQ